MARVRVGRSVVIVLTLATGLAIVGSSSGAPEIRQPPTRAPVVAPRDAGAGARSGFSAADKAAILKQMNDLRASLQAPAMAQLTWDDNLEAFATRHVDKCVWSHSTSAARSSIPGWNGTYCGENIAGQQPASLTTPQVASNLINMWWSEKADYNPATGQCAPNKICGRFTQLAWSTTTKVGCAINMCTQGLPMPNMQFLTCNFGPGGNGLNQKAY